MFLDLFHPVGLEDSVSMTTATMTDRNVVRHPQSNKIVLGSILPPGVVLKESDVFNSPCGKWAPCDEKSPYYQQKNPRPTGKVVFVRPIDE